MGLFSKNPNEAAYLGGKKHWVDVIKNTGHGELLIWRQQEEDFNTNATLIVMHGEEAVFIKGGMVEKVFESGTYKLSTNNYPFVSRLKNSFSGGVSTFNCVVYFVRKADSQEIRWGTETPIMVRDKVWGVRTDARARGMYKVRIEDSVKILEKLIGNNVPYRLQEELDTYFAVEFQGKIKTAVSKFLNALQQELIGIDAYLDELSGKIEPYIDEVISEYGLKCVRFSLAGLDIDTTKYDAMDESQIVSIGKMKLAQGDKTAMNVMGEDWGRQQAANILSDLANNQGAGGVGAMGAGMGVGMAAGNVFGDMANQIFAPMNQQTQQPSRTTTSIHNMTSERFTPKGTDIPERQQNVDNNNSMRVLEQLKKMLDKGLIEQSEYEEKKNEILSQM